MPEKNDNLELLRLLSCLMVIVIHVANYFCRAYPLVGQGAYLYALLLDTAARFSVPCFFMLSGAFLLPRKPGAAKCWKKALHFTLILAVWSVVYWAFNTWVTGEACDLGAVLHTPTEAHLWYLYVLIALYLVLPFLQAMIQGMSERLEHLFALVGIIWLTAYYVCHYLGSKFYYDLPIFGDRCYVYYFYLGYYLKKYLPRLHLPSAAWLGVYALGTLAVTVWNVFETSAAGVHQEELLQYGNPLLICSSAAMFAAFFTLRGGKVPLSDRAKRRIGALSGCCFGVYLAHILLLDLYKMHVPAETGPVWLLVPGLTAALAAGTLAAVYLFRRAASSVRRVWTRTKV